MKTTADFLDALRAKLELNSDGKLADYLGMHRQHISRYRTGGHTFDDAMSLRVADILETDPAYVVACMHHQRAKNEAERTIWQRLAALAAEHKAVTASLFAVCCALIMSAGGAPLEGLPLLSLAAFTEFNPSIHYAQLTLADFLNWPVFIAFFVLMVCAFPWHPARKKQPRKEAHTEA